MIDVVAIAQGFALIGCVILSGVQHAQAARRLSELEIAAARRDQEIGRLREEADALRRREPSLRLVEPAHGRAPRHIETAAVDWVPVAELGIDAVVATRKGRAR